MNILLKACKNETLKFPILFIINLEELHSGKLIQIILVLVKLRIFM